MKPSGPRRLNGNSVLKSTPKSDRDAQTILSADTQASSPVDAIFTSSTTAFSDGEPFLQSQASHTSPTYDSPVSSNFHTSIAPTPTTFLTKFTSQSTDPTLWVESSTSRPLTTSPPTSNLLYRRQEIWRISTTPTTTVEACQPLTISSGTFIVGTKTIVLSPDNTNPALFHPLCISGRPVLGTVPIPSSIPDLVANQSDAWSNWIDNEGSFKTSVVPLMYSIAASSATCWLVSIAVIGFQRRRSLLYKLCLVCSSIFLLVVLITSTDELSRQFHAGYLDSITLRDVLRASNKVNILNLAFNTILYLGQVQSAMHLFSRQKEKRLILWLGGSLTIIAQTIWGVSVFHPNVKESSLPAFAYLFQIAMSVLYAGCVFYYAITKRSYTLTPSTIFLTVLAVGTACSTIILFIIDLASIWILEWSDSMNWITTVLSIVTVWELTDRVYSLERLNEKQGVLGRQVYDGEVLNSFTKGPPQEPSAEETSSGGSQSKKSSQNGSDYSGTTYTSEPLQASNHKSPHSPTSVANINHTVIDSPFDPYESKPTLVRYFHKATFPIVYMSDLIINIGLSVSRPQSESSAGKKSPTPGVQLEPITTTTSQTSHPESQLNTFIHPVRKSIRATIESNQHRNDLTQ